MRVLHIDSEKAWRGGENQMRLLIEGSRRQVESYLLCPPESEAAKRLKDDATIWAGGFNGLELFKTAHRIDKLIREHGIQVLDCQSSKAHNMGLLLKWKNPSLKLIVHRRVDNLPAPLG